MGNQNLIHIQPHPDFTDTGLLERAVQVTLEQQAAASDAALTVVLAEDAKLRKLNRDYLGIDEATDVLSFPAAETDPDSGARYLGDILISIPRARQQANQAGHPLQAELQLLVVHGVLHLLGYDHANPPEKNRMWSAQAEILARLGLAGLKLSE